MKDDERTVGTATRECRCCTRRRNALLQCLTRSWGSRLGYRGEWGLRPAVGSRIVLGLKACSLLQVSLVTVEVEMAVELKAEASL